MAKETLVLIYEHEQVDSVAAFVRNHPEIRVIALDFWAGRTLAEHGIESIPLSTYCPPYEDVGDLRKRTGDIARQWYRLPECAFFAHDGILFGEAHEPAVDIYLQHALFYLFALKRIIDANPACKKIAVPHTTHPVPPTGGPLMALEGHIIVDTVRFLSHKNKLDVEYLGASRAVYGAQPFPRQSTLKVVLLRMYNACISLIASRKPIKIFASEYWWHIAPFIQKMDDVEVVMMDRRESRNVPYGELLKHRMRFIHPLDEIDSRIRRIAAERRTHFAEEWKIAKETVRTMPEFNYKGIDWWPLVEQGFDFLVGVYAERVVADLEAFKKIFKREGTNKLLLRASMSLHQHHFYIAAQVARNLDIPSIELQHAGIEMGPSDPSSRFTASYLASYGPHVRDFLAQRQGVAPERVRSIGSPRFDHYLTIAHVSTDERKVRLQKLGLDPSRPIVFVNVPPEAVGLSPGHFNSYELAGFFRALRHLKDTMPSLQYILKFRARSLSPIRARFIKELFPTDVAVAEYEDLITLLLLSDAAFSCISTVLCEAMIMKKPVVLFPWKQHDPHLELYRTGGIALDSHTQLDEVVRRLFADKAFYDDALEMGQRFLRAHYSFDGHASERTALLIREQLPRMD